MKHVKKYLTHNVTEDELKIFGYKKDEKGYYITVVEYDSEEEERAANSAAWSEYWGQFSQEEIFASTFYEIP